MRKRKNKSNMMNAQDFFIILTMFVSMIAMLILGFSIESWANETGDDVSTEEASVEESEETSEESSVEESEELSEGFSVEESVEPSAEFTEESEESKGAIVVSDEEFRLLCYVAYAEAGSEAPECLIGTLWNMRNGYLKKGEGDFIAYLTFPARYSVVQEDGTILSGDGVVTDNMISVEFKDLVRRVLSGEIPDPTRGYECYVAFERINRDRDFTDPDEFANFYGITDYVVLGRHLFFPETQWPEDWN